MRSHASRHHAHQRCVLRASPRCVPRAHSVSGGPDRADPTSVAGGVRPLKIAVRGEAPCDLAPARRAVRAALRPYGVTQDAELVLAFVDDAAMRELNRRYRRKDRTTDVLSFGPSLRRGAKGPAAAAALRREADG